MSDRSPSLDLPYIQAAQAQKHVTHNEAVEKLDLLAQLVVQDFAQSSPPSSAPEGRAWAIPVGATGDWAGRAGQIASWRGGGWLYVTPAVGWRAWGEISGDFRVYDGTSWVPVTGDVDFDNLDGVGVNASADATNRLVVSAPATLLNHEGAGHQLKVNKAASGDTASLLYQTGFSGRAEMGTTGTDDFAIKVSADGAAWTDAQRIDAATGVTTARAVTGEVVDIAPDTVAQFATPSTFGMVVLCVFRAPGSGHPPPAHAGLMFYDVGTSPGLVGLNLGVNLENLGTAVLTSASGTVDHSGISAHDGLLEIVNRTAEVLSYNLTFLGGLAGR